MDTSQSLDELKRAAANARAALDADGALARYIAALEQRSEECAAQLRQRTAELEIINSVQQRVTSLKMLPKANRRLTRKCYHPFG